MIGPTMEAGVFSTRFGAELPAKLNQPPGADTLFVLGHGSGSTIDVPFMAAMSEALSDFRIASLRFEYPYSADSSFIPFTDMPVDDDETLIATMRSAIEYGKQKCPALKVLVGGHSISGLLATQADAEEPLAAVGIVALGFPREGDPARSQHLPNTTRPLLFVQGTNDTLGSRSEIEEMAVPLGNRATLHWIEDATHGFSVEGRELGQIATEIAKTVRQFADQVSGN